MKASLSLSSGEDDNEHHRGLWEEVQEENYGSAHSYSRSRSRSRSRKCNNNNSVNKNRCAVATKDIVEGTVIVRNIPFSFVVHHDRREERCASCFQQQSLKRCSRCKSTWYCSRKCQMNDFMYHKIECHEVQLINNSTKTRRRNGSDSISGNCNAEEESSSTHHSLTNTNDDIRLLIRTFLKLIVQQLGEEKGEDGCSIIPVNKPQQTIDNKQIGRNIKSSTTFPASASALTCSCSKKHFMQLQPFGEHRSLDPDEVTTLRVASQILFKHRKVLQQQQQQQRIREVNKKEDNNKKSQSNTTIDNDSKGEDEDDGDDHGDDPKQEFTERSIQHALEAIFRRFRINNFGIVDSIMNLLGSGVYPLGALLNHSCTPNCILRYTAGSSIGEGAIMEIVAVRDIRAGEELTHSYVELVSPTAKRQNHLQTIHDFQCACPSCQQKTQITLPADYKDRNDLTGWVLDRYNPHASTATSKTDMNDGFGLIQVPLDEIMQPSVDHSIFVQANMLQHQANVAMSNDDVLMELECLARAQKLLEERSGSNNEICTMFSIDVYRILGRRLSSLIAARHSSSEEESTSMIRKLSNDALDVCCKIVAIQCLALHEVPNHPLLGLQLFTLGDLYEENGYNSKASSIFHWAYHVLKICQGPSNFMVRMLEEKLK